MPAKSIGSGCCPAARAMPVAATPEAQAPPDPLFLSTLRLRV
jgi:hypothetical protein